MNSDPLHPNEGLARLFGETSGANQGRPSPFGEAPAAGDPQSRLRASIVRLRLVRGQAGSDGLTPSATRSLLDELLRALEAIEEALPPGSPSAGGPEGDDG
jgi:hypothetical protein